jgi:DNA-binding PucR family transcriptional regulator
MTTPDPSDEGRTEPVLRDQLSSLQALLALSMRMTDSNDETQILGLASTAVPTLGRCRLIGAHLSDDGWQPPPQRPGQAQQRSEVAAQLAIVGVTGGAIAVGDDEWGWAFPLRSSGYHLGYLAVSAGAEPSRAEQFVLRVLAQQTGIALANARLHSRERRQAAEVLDANSRLAATVAALERSTTIHDRLTRAAVNGAGQQGIAEALHDLTGFAVALEDRYGNLRAWAGPLRPDPYLKESAERREAVVRRALEAAAPIRHEGRLVVVIRAHDDGIGVIALVDPHDVAGDDARVALEHGATVLAMELARLSSIAETELRLQRDLVDDLLAGAGEASAVARAEVLGYDLERPHRVVVVKDASGVIDGDDFYHAVRRSARDCGVGTLLVTHEQSVVVLADTNRSWEAFRLALVDELQGARCQVGVGSVCDGVIDFPRSHREALLALRVQAAAGGGDQATVFDDLGVYRLLACVDDLELIEGFVQRWLGDLLRYDTGKEASELVVTLAEYFERGRSYDATARALVVHRSTLKYRLRRIREISGHDLGDPEVQFNLQLAVRAWRTMRAVRGEAS